MQKKSDALRAWERRGGRHCICCPNKQGLPLVAHHRQPKSQNGQDIDSNLRPPCTDCHGRYHTATGQRLAMRVEDRVANHGRWLQDCGVQPDLMGVAKGLAPWQMSPQWVEDEFAYWFTIGKYKDMSKGRLSRIGKVQEFEQREFPT